MNLKRLIKRSIVISSRYYKCERYFSTETPEKEKEEEKAKAMQSFHINQNGRGRDSLFRRISPMRDPTVSIVPIVDGWIADGFSVTCKQIRQINKRLRRLRRFAQALQISEWMASQRYFDLKPADIAIRLVLVSKVHGVDQAEKFFNNIPKKSRTLEVYVALFHCYAQKNAVDKVEPLFQAMKEMGFVTHLTYNALLKSYNQIGQHEKLKLLMKEMVESGIPCDLHTYKIRMGAYRATSNIEGMESILRRMEADQRIVMDWDAYLSAANVYINTGLVDKALLMLKKSEEIASNQNAKVAYKFLLTMYAKIGWKDDIYRIWNHLKESVKYVRNDSYVAMVSSLIKMDDLDGAEKIMQEWETSCFCYDFRVPNQLIFEYCKKGQLHKAELIISKAIEKGCRPYSTTWERMASEYVLNSQIPKAVEMMKNALSASRQARWKPNHVTLHACLEFFEKQGDVEGFEEFVSLLKALSPLTRDVYLSLIRTYLVAERPVSDIVDRMKKDGLDADEETQKVLKTGSLS